MKGIKTIAVILLMPAILTIMLISAANFFESDDSVKSKNDMTLFTTMMVLWKLLFKWVFSDNEES